MQDQYMHEKLANLLLDIEVDLKIASTTENKELSVFTKKLLRKIAESREKDGI